MGRGDGLGVILCWPDARVDPRRQLPLTCAAPCCPHNHCSCWGREGHRRGCRSLAVAAGHVVLELGRRQELKKGNATRPTTHLVEEMGRAPPAGSSGRRDGAETGSQATCSQGRARCLPPPPRPARSPLSESTATAVSHRTCSPSQLPLDTGQEEPCWARRSTLRVAAGHPSGQEVSGALRSPGAIAHPGW